MGAAKPLTKWTEVPYLFVHGVRLARVVYNESSPEVGANKTHVFLEIGDHLGSTSVVIDHATGELVERGTYQPYGAKESDYRPTRWQEFREDYGFTGKEEDVQVGLTYFGKRFLSPYLNRWVSADPLAVHVPGRADPNLYAYVAGAALKSTDPMGLEVACDAACLDRTGMNSAAPFQKFAQDWSDSAKYPAAIRWVYRAHLINQSPTTAFEALTANPVASSPVLAAGKARASIGTVAAKAASALIRAGAEARIVSHFRSFAKAGAWEQAAGWAYASRSQRQALAADYLSLRPAAAQQARSSIWESLLPFNRGNFIEEVEAQRSYKGWQRVGEMENGKFPTLDFQKGNTNVSFATHDAQTLDTLTGKLKQLESLAQANPGQKFMLDVRTRTVEQAESVMKNLSSDSVQVKASVWK